MTNYGFIETLDDFPTTAEIGDILFCTKDNKTYIYYDEGSGKPFGWKEYQGDPNALINLGLTEYDINKMVISKLPSLIKDNQLKEAKEIIKEYTHRYILAEGYYMLLCNELRYYTVFHVCDEYEENVEDIVIECLQNIGVIQQINYADDNKGAVECWIKNEDGVFMFMLFDYEQGVITCK